jgi:ABC-type multidrug transport system ATPase subunit
VRNIETNTIELTYGSQKILDKVGFSLCSGKITALIGPNGAGKSSAFRILAGLVKPDAGEAYIDKKKVDSFEDLRNCCGYLLESPDFYPYLSGKKNLEMLINLSGSKSDAMELLKLVGLENEASKKVQNYSRGMKQRLGFAQVMIDDPDFLVLDEPFNGLDPEVKEHMLNFLVTLKNQGKGILVSTHLLEDIENIADDFILLHKGKVFLQGEMQTYRESRQNVTLYFSQAVPDIKIAGIEFDISGDTIHLMASIPETEELLRNLLGRGHIPYRVTRSSILHDRYMEIAR